MSLNDFVVLCILALAVGADFGLAAWALARGRGWLKAIAAFPVAVLIVWGAAIAFETTRNPSAHNLWPIELLLVAALGCLFSAACMAALPLPSRKVTHASR